MFENCWRVLKLNFLLKDSEENKAEKTLSPSTLTKSWLFASLGMELTNLLHCLKLFELFKKYLKILFTLIFQLCFEGARTFGRIQPE